MSEGLRFPTRSKYQPGAAFDHTAREQKQPARTRGFELQSCHPLLAGGHQNPNAGQNNHGACKTRREERDALVSVEKVGRGRFPADHRCGEIGEACRPSGHEIGSRFANQDLDANDQ